MNVISLTVYLSREKTLHPLFILCMWRHNYRLAGKNVVI